MNEQRADGFEQGNAEPPARTALILRERDLGTVDRGNGVLSVPIATPASAAGAGIVTGMTRFPPGTEFPLHSHGCAEHVTIVEGVARVQIEDETVVVEAYDSTFIPAGLVHSFANAGDTVMRILWVYVGDRVTRTFAATGKTVEHLSAGDVVS